MTESAPHYDAVVVGAGPAGALAAHELAQGGARVLLVEKARLPRYKPCGGGLTPRARAVSALVARFPADAQVDTLLLPCRQRLLSCHLPAPLTMVMRDRFDAYLAAQAVAAGAELRDGTALTALERVGTGLRLVAGGATISTRYVIGADGATGVSARLAGFAPVVRKGVPALEIELAVCDAVRRRYERAAVIDAVSVHGGYGWIFGKAAHLSIGVASFLPAGRHSLRASLSAFLARHDGLKDGQTLQQHGHIIPLARQRAAWRRGPVLLAGDAAGLADPLTGEGISYALASGRRAGRAVLEALHEEATALNRYERFVDRTLGGNLRSAGWIAALAYRYPIPLLETLGPHDSLRAGAGSAIVGMLPYRMLATRLAWHGARLAPALIAGSRQSGLRPKPAA